MANNKLDNLQATRGLAALFVCFFHARFTLNDGYHWGDLLFGRGIIGVPLFFVISGFIMVYTTKNLTDNATYNVKVFLLKRFIRIIPLYYILTFFWIIIIKKQGFYLNEGFPDLITSLLFYPTVDSPVLYVGWTLNYEMFFYIIFGLCIAFKSKRLYVFLSLFFVFIFIIPFFTVGYLSINPNISIHPISNYLYFISDPLLLFFAMGVILAMFIHKIKIHLHLTYLLVIISILFFGINYFQLFHFSLSDLLFCSFLIFSILLLDFSDNKIKMPKFMIYLGDISYSVYLIHPLIILLLRRFFIAIGLGSFTISVYFLLISVAGVIISSIITYELIEKKLTNYLRKIIIPNRNS